MSVGLENLPQRVVLEPGVVLWGLHQEGAPREGNGVIQVLQIEEHAGKVQQNVRVIGADGQGSTKTLQGQLRVALDSPEVANLVVNLRRLGFLKVKSIMSLEYTLLSLKKAIPQVPRIIS